MIVLCVLFVRDDTFVLKIHDRIIHLCSIDEEITYLEDLVCFIAYMYYCLMVIGCLCPCCDVISR